MCFLLLWRTVAGKLFMEEKHGLDPLTHSDKGGWGLTDDSVRSSSHVLTHAVSFESIAHNEWVPRVDNSCILDCTLMKVPEITMKILFGVFDFEAETKVKAVERLWYTSWIQNLINQDTLKNTMYIPCVNCLYFSTCVMLRLYSHYLMIAFIGERHTNPNLVQHFSKFGALGISAVVWNVWISQN